jgi:Protein of unknown function (DUF3995)
LFLPGLQGTSKTVVSHSVRSSSSGIRSRHGREAAALATITMLDAAIALRSLVVTGGVEGGTTMTRFRDHDDEHLRRAIELAREARTRGNVPFGSVLVGEAGATLAEGRNTVTTERDAPGHVETNLLRAAFRSLDAQTLVSSALHSIAEPRASRASAGARPDPLTRSPTAGALLLDNLTKEQSTSTALEERSARHGRRIRRHARSDIGHAEAVAGVASYAASAQALAAVHLYWALGGTVGQPKGISVDMNPALFVIDVLAVSLCVVGALLALSLVRPWGRLFPRRFLLACAWGCVRC